MATHDILFNFRPNGQFPIDSRIVAANEAARYAIPAGAVYEGLVVYEELTEKLFLLNDESNANNIDGWTEINTGSSGTGGQSETSLFQSGAGGTLQETFWIGTKGQYDARSDDQKASETVHYITDDLTLVTGAGENTNTYLLSDFGITSTAAQIDHAAQELEGISLGADIATADSTTVFTNKSGAISQWTNDSGYLTTQISHTNVVDESSTVTVNADSTQTNGGSVDANGDLTINVDLPDLTTLITRENVLNDDFDPTGLWDFRNATVLGVEGGGGDITKADVDAALGTGNQSADRFYTSNNGGSWENFPDTEIADGSITNAKLDDALQTAITEAGTALQSLPTINLSDLSADVQTTLGEIDTALQEVPFGNQSTDVAVWARGNNTTTQIPADILENALSSDTVRTYADVAAFTAESGVTWNKGDRAFFEDTNNYYFYTGTDGNTSVVLANDFVQLTVDDITTLTGYTALNGRVMANDSKVSFDSTSSSKVGNISVTQPVDLDAMESNIATNNAKVTYNSTDSTKVGNISITQPVDLDTIESNVATNNNKNSYPSGDATKVGHLTVTSATDLDTMRSNVQTNNSKVSYNSTDSAKVGHISVTQAVDLDTMESNIATNNAKTSFPGSPWAATNDYVTGSVVSLLVSGVWRIYIRTGVAITGNASNASPDSSTNWTILTSDASADVAAYLASTGTKTINGRVGIGREPQQAELEIFTELSQTRFRLFSDDDQICSIQFRDGSGVATNLRHNHANDAFDIVHTGSVAMSVTPTGVSFNRPVTGGGISSLSVGPNLPTSPVSGQEHYLDADEAPNTIGLYKYINDTVLWVKITTT